jgi:hypothetical protein
MMVLAPPDHPHSVVAEAVMVETRDREIDAANLDLGHLLRFDNGVPRILLDLRRVVDFAFTHAARTQLAEANDPERSGRAPRLDYYYRLERRRQPTRAVPAAARPPSAKTEGSGITAVPKARMKR